MIIGLLIFWIIGIIAALLGNKRIREYKHYESPKIFLTLGIFLCITMSWSMVLALLMSREYILPLWLYHNCMEHSDVTFEEEYLDENGNKVDGYPYSIHHTYRIYTCRICGKVTKEKLQ